MVGDYQPIALPVIVQSARSGVLAALGEYLSI